MNKALRFIGLIGAICTTLVGQSHVVAEPYLHWMIIIGLVCSTTIAYFMEPPRNPESHDRVSDTKLNDLNKKDA